MWITKKKRDYDPRGLENLANGIVERAAEDYATAFMGGSYENKDPEWIMHECESFFRSKWYEGLTSVNPEWLMKQVKIRELEKMIAVYEEVLKGDRDFTYKICSPKTKEQQAVNYTIPPRFAEDFEKLVRRQLIQLREELAQIR